MLAYWFTLLYRCIFGSLAVIGQTWIGIIWACITILVSLGLVGYTGGVSAVRAHAGKVGVEVVVVAILSWLPFFLWQVAKMPMEMQQEAVTSAQKTERDTAAKEMAQKEQELAGKEQQIGKLNEQLRQKGTAPQGPTPRATVSGAEPPRTGGQGDNSAQITSAVQKVLNFPNAVNAAAPKTILETLLINQTPRKLFETLVPYDDAAIAAVPESGALLQDFFRKYYQFENDEVQFENELLRQIGGAVAVRFPAGWGIYLKYAILRFSGNSTNQIMASGNFLNYEITWDDAERVYKILSDNEATNKNFSNIFARYKAFVETTDQLKSAN